MSNGLLDWAEDLNDEPTTSASSKPAKPKSTKPAKPAAKKAPAAKAKGAAGTKKKTAKDDALANGINGVEENGHEYPAGDVENVFETIEHATNHGRKSLTVEEVYKKVSQLDHVLLRPDSYIGTVEKQTDLLWVYNRREGKLEQREITYVPGLYKIFDEILVNAADNKQRDSKGMNTIRVTIDQDKNEISVYNNGRGIPVVKHKMENMWVPELIFGTLLTSSNYNDDDKKVVGGRNGFGAKLCNIFSTKFMVETSHKQSKKQFKQIWRNNMNKDVGKDALKENGLESKVSAMDDDDFTKVTFRPDLKRFKMTTLDDDICDLMAKRAYDIAGSTKGVKVFLNGKKIPFSGFQEYVNMYLKDRTDEDNKALDFVYQKFSDRWEVAVTHSGDKGFQQVSFVNSIATTKGGKHVDYITEQIVEKVVEHVKKSIKKSGFVLRPLQVKNQLWVFVNCLIENPTFDSQTKEQMTLLPKQFGSECKLAANEKFFKTLIAKTSVVKNIQDWITFKQQSQLDKQSGSKKQKIKGVLKLEDAKKAGSKDSAKCTLIVTEGDSAKTLATSGLAVVPSAADYYGIFPLRGKLLNTREATFKQRHENAEIQNLIKILGLKTTEKYTEDKSFNALRYGKLMIMTDQDQDGSHIKGLIINFIHHQWPALLRRSFVEEFITPIIKATKGNESLSFYSEPEFDEWKNRTPNYRTYRIKYYKGLGTSTASEAREYFSDMQRHRIKFRYGGQDDDISLEMAFKRDKVEDRKTWLTNWMEDQKRRRELGLGEIYLYEKDTKSVSYKDFVNKELVVFANSDNERSIPNLMDGLKPSQRKVLYLCFKRDMKKEIKVGQLANAVSEHTAYHHGEVSLQMTIVNLAQNFVGSNNMNLLMPIGQFGSRIQGGKDCAAARYIFTNLHPLTRHVFNRHDDAIVRYQVEDNMRIEPDWYCPILPMILVNGSEGIGTGWSTKVPNFNPVDIVENLRRMIRDEEPERMNPWYKNFTGQVAKVENQKYVTCGNIARLDDDNVYEITELPIKSWTQNFKEMLENMSEQTEKSPRLIEEYTNYSTDTTVKFEVKIAMPQLANFRKEGFHKMFKLYSNVNTSNIVLFDHNGVLKTYDDEMAVLREFYDVRIRKYHERYAYLEGMLQAQADRLSEQARFILLKIDGKITLENKKKKAIVEQLIQHNFKRDPVKTWKDDLEKKLALSTAEEVNTEEEDEGQAQAEPEKNVMTGYDYLVNQYLIKLSWEEKAKLEKERDEKLQELEVLQGKSAKDLWIEDLDNFMVEYQKTLDKEKAEATSNMGTQLMDDGKGGKKAKGRKGAGKLRKDIAPTEWAEPVDPDFEGMKAKFENEAIRKAGARKRTKKEDAGLDLDEDLMKRVIKDRRKSGKDLKPTLTIQRFLTGDTKKKAAKTSDLDDIDDSDVEVIEPTKGSPKRKRSPAKKASSVKKPRDDSQTTPSASDAEAVDDDDEEVLPRVLPGRQRKPVKYNFDEDSEGEKDSGGAGSESDVKGGDSDDDFDDDVPMKKTKKPAPKKVVESDEDLSDQDEKDSDDDYPAPRKTEKAQRRVIESDDDESSKKSDEVVSLSNDPTESKKSSDAEVLPSDDDTAPPLPTFAAKKAPTTKAGTSKQPMKRKAPPAKKSPAKKPAKKNYSESESEPEMLPTDSEDDSPVRKKSKPKAKARRVSSDESDFAPDDIDTPPVAASGRTGRAAAKGKTYKDFDSGESE